MKTHIKTAFPHPWTRDFIIYTCEICGNVSAWKKHIEQCEKTCKCVHKDYYYSMDRDTDYDMIFVVDKRCNNCNMLIERVTIDMEDQNMSKEIHELLKSKKGK